MKITKVIEVEVCDNCQAEQHAVSDVKECCNCKKIMCYRCAEVVSFRVVNSVPEAGSFLDGTYRSTCRETDFYGRLCIDCAAKVIEALKQFGIVKTEKNSY